MTKVYYQPEFYHDDGINIEYGGLPKELFSFQVFATIDDCKEWLIGNGYDDRDFAIHEYHDDAIEDVTFLDKDGNPIDYCDAICIQAQGYMETLVMWRGTKKELEKELSDHFGKKITLADTTENDCEESKEYDYRYTFNLIGEDDEYEDYIDIDIYFLKMRKKGHIYITETNVEYY